MNEDDITNQTGKALDDSVDALDARVLSRLNQARQAALQQRQPRSHWLIPVVFASLAVVAVLLAIDPVTSPLPESDMLVDSDDLELIEDIEFMTWLAEQQDAG